MNSRRDFIYAVAAVAGVGLLPGCTRGVEDPQKTKLFAAFLTGLLTDKVATSELTERMKGAMTPDAVAAIRRRYAPLGTFVRLRFVGQDEVGGFQRYHYAASFQHGSQAMFFALDDSGKIAGFFNE